MSAIMNEQLVAVAQAARAAGHGGKTAIYRQACERLGISLPTLHRKLKEATTLKKTQKQRSDAGKSGLTYEEGLTIAGAFREARSQKGKKRMSLGDVTKALRDNGFIRAERIDKSTGELIPLSESAISRALRGYGLHPDQLDAPNPHITLSSPHPNWCWQIDASLCVLYYLRPHKNPQMNGLRVMKEDEFYKNKPKNLEKIAANRVWSYEITDHTTGWIYVEYVMGAESGENLCNVLINAMQERGGADVMHGVPKILYMDPGSANTSSMAKNLCQSLGIKAIAHAPGSARATGQVENARNIIETQFESGLVFQPIHSLEDLNERAALWRRVFNATKKHSRHGMTRTDCWLKHIKAEQLIKAPPVDVCKRLAVSMPEPRTVHGGEYGMYIKWDNAHYNVVQVPGLQVGDKVLVTHAPLHKDAVHVVVTGEQGYQEFHVVPKIEHDVFGQPLAAPVIGESYARVADTPAQKAKAVIEQMMTGTDSTDAAATARKTKAIPLGGRFDPLKAAKEITLPEYMPRRGTEHSLQPPVVITPNLTVLQIAKALRGRLGDAWQPEYFSWLQSKYPEGAKEDELPMIEQQLLNPKPALKVVGGHD